ncbi:ABC transporter permease [Chondrinema litorale]|uniref:ABC transporter permease n=1 Tax=Chondrinema litorale TaxID=2994555 RepID=UPI0025445EA5|nr:ABC transporter permease [Chondrinema litorale]UZR94582.1 ABC transporter permease [Chondrinema litorale]
MLKHHILLALRSFKRFKSSLFINLTGLSTGLACTMLIFLWVNDELKVDRFHAQDDRLYQVMEHQKYADNIMTTTSTPGVLAEGLKDEIPEIKYAATTTWISKYTLSFGEKNLKANGYHVGEDFFNIFSYNLIQGDADQVLKDKSSIVISKSLAESLFGNTEDAIGKQIEYQHDRTFLVSGIFDEIPTNSSYQFDFVLSFEDYKDDNGWVLNWGNNGPKTFVILTDDADANELSDKIAEFVKGKNEESNVTLFLQKYSERYLHGSYENGQQSGGRIEYVNMFSIIAIFILIIACINFMNLSTARASRRTKEVGIKKALGVKRYDLVIQFMGESIMVSLFSLVIATLMVWIVLPEFNNITDKQILLDFDPVQILGFLVIAILTGIVSGSYPALYLSGFQPVKVLKGELRTSLGELWVRRGLVIFQFTLSVVLIVSVMVIYKQIDFVQNKNLGYNKDNVIYFETEGKVNENPETFLTELRKKPGVKAASSISNVLLGRNSNTSGVSWEGKDPDANILFENVRVNHDMLETLGIEMKEGRSFSRDFSTDTSKIIFNEAAIKVMGLEDPIGKTIDLWGEYKLEIVGIAKDFHFQSLHEQVKPLFFVLSPENTWYVMARLEAGREKETIDRLTNFYQSYNPGFTFDFQFMDEEYRKMYAAEQRVSSLSKYFAGFAILISCLGLFGLAAFTAERRTKEIGIRKALGSSSFNILLLISSDFTKMVLIAIGIALPFSYWIIQSWLEKFAFRIDLEIWFFALAGFLALLVAWLTVGSQAIKAATLNPAKCLKDQ